VSVPDVVGLDQASATSELQALGLEVEIQFASSRSKPAGEVLRSSPGTDATAVRGDTVTLTVSSGPKQVTVPELLTWEADDAEEELEDRGFAVAFATVVATGDEIDTVVAQSPAGGQAPEGSTVTLTIGVKAKR
jgi:serine/threonine-protein kinase